MREGLRCEAAGALAEAKERYSLALQGRFEGPQNRTDTLKHLGLLYLDEGKLDEAAKNLGEAADSPYAPITVYGPLCDVLLKLERYDETEKTVAVWRKVLEKYPNADALAEANRAAERAQQLRAGHQ
jgi:tetratricopeptide (TPR) repeat protein